MPVYAPIFPRQSDITSNLDEILVEKSLALEAIVKFYILLSFINIHLSHYNRCNGIGNKTTVRSYAYTVD